jgi:MacB-like periplasmic core domain
MTTASGRTAAARLRPTDLAALASVGLRTRKLRAALSALGIAIGVAAIVAVLGLAASAQAALLAEIQALGTNLLTVSNGQTLTGTTAELPDMAPGMIARLPGVTAVQAIATISGVSAYKSPLIPPVETNALSVDAATLNLPTAAGTSLAQGRFLNAATAREPVAVLGATTAQLLGIDRIHPGLRIWVGGRWFYLAGILNSDTYAPHSTRRSWSASPPRTPTCTTTGTRRPSTSAPPRTTRPPPPGPPACSAHRPARKAPARSPSPSPPRRSPPKPTPKAPSTPCTSAWAPSPCWSARSGSPTS